MKTLLLGLLALPIFLSAQLSAPTAHTLHFPWKEAGLIERQAAEHLLNRFSYGATTADINQALAMGLEQWFEQQLLNDQPDPEVLNRIKDFKTIAMSNKEIAEVYPTPGKVILELMRDGKLKDLGDLKDSNNKEFRRTALKYAYENGYRPQKELLGEMIAWKILRARYSHNQLQEVMTDFWFNHFTVSMVKGQARTFIPSYERDAIRPNALGSFRTLLEATAKHPAMLQYLDNAQSTAAEGTPTLLSIKLDSLKNLGGIKGWFAKRKINAAQERMEDLKEEFFKGFPAEFKPKRGINENYARELMELHTLGVDGGYSQQDVTEVARALTGWSMMPLGYTKRAEKIMDMIEKGKKLGTVVQGDFLFRTDAHDAAEKTILGVKFAAGRGMDEGEEILTMLSNHPSTVKRIATKLCIRFVCDAPPSALVQDVANAFRSSHGDIKSVLRAIVSSPEFWAKDNLRAKIKTPFELAISSLRAVNADVTPTKALYDWIVRLGEPLYSAQAPTGFPDKAEAWVNTGSLLNRMNYGLAVASGSIKGISTDIMALNKNREPESASSALSSYSALLMPERDCNETIRLLTPVISDPNFGKKVSSEAEQYKSPSRLMNQGVSDTDDDTAIADELEEYLSKGSANKTTASPTERSAATVQNVVGLLLGSPEFQRR